MTLSCILMMRPKYIISICIQFSTMLSATCPLNTDTEFLHVIIFSPVNYYLTWLMFFLFCPSHLAKKIRKDISETHPFNLGRWTVLKILVTSATVHHRQHYYSTPPTALLQYTTDSTATVHHRQHYYSTPPTALLQYTTDSTATVHHRQHYYNTPQTALLQYTTDSTTTVHQLQHYYSTIKWTLPWHLSKFQRKIFVITRITFWHKSWKL
jgi:hypothetical protein